MDFTLRNEFFLNNWSLIFSKRRSAFVKKNTLDYQVSEILNICFIGSLNHKVMSNWLGSLHKFSNSHLRRSREAGECGMNQLVDTSHRNDKSRVQRARRKRALAKVGDRVKIFRAMSIRWLGRIVASLAMAHLQPRFVTRQSAR